MKVHKFDMVGNSSIQIHSDQNTCEASLNPEYSSDNREVMLVLAMTA